MFVPSPAADCNETNTNTTRGTCLLLLTAEGTHTRAHKIFVTVCGAPIGLKINVYLQ